MKKHLPNLLTAATAVTVLMALGVFASLPVRAQDLQIAPQAPPSTPHDAQTASLTPLSPQPQDLRRAQARPARQTAREAPPLSRPWSEPPAGQDAETTSPEPPLWQPQALLVPAQTAPSQITVGGVTIVGVPDDWSFHHSYFSNPGTEQEAIKNGKHDEWLKIVNEPRYIIQQLHRHAPVQGPLATQVAALEAQPPNAALQTAPGSDPDRRRRPHKDWSVGMGPGALGPTSYPAKWSFYTSGASCSGDFVVFPTGVAGSSTQASIIAYNNLYVGCGGTVPSVYWAYNTGGTTFQSPIFSANGSQVAFIQLSSSNVSSLVVLTWAAGQGTGYTSPNSSPTMSSVTFNGSPEDGWSNPYYDYATDSLWVGANDGKLHKFNPVFNGTPAEVTTNWPVTLNTSYYVTSPVYDRNSGCVFAGNLDGILYSVNSGISGTVCTGNGGSPHAYTASLTSCANSGGIMDGPLLDQTAGAMYIFSESYHSSSTYYDALAQELTNFSGSGTVTWNGYAELLGDGLRTGGSSFCGASIFPAGTFDNVYLDSSSPTSPSGHIYLVANMYGPATLYQVTVTSNALPSSGGIVTGPSLEGSGYIAAVSPVTEFCNNGVSACGTNGTITTPGTDYLFVSSFYASGLSGCGTQGTSTGCIMPFNITTPSAFTSSSAPSGSLSVVAEGTPTMGIIIDNSVPAGTTATSQIYTAQLDSGGAAGTVVSALWEGTTGSSEAYAHSTCDLSASNGGGTGATFTIAIGSSYPAAGTALTITNAGSGYTSAPTTATGTNYASDGCGGTFDISTTLGSPTTCGTNGSGICAIQTSQ